jgi:glycosyltransferase involved in cell wall biosynthesis
VIEHSCCTVICTEKRKEQIAGSHPKKLEIIHNTPKQINFDFCSDTQEFKLTNRCKIVYVGILAGSRFLREIIDFVKNDDRFEFHIGGFGTLADEIECASKECDRIVYHGKLPYDKTLALEDACDIMTAIYDPSVPNHKYAAPNKFYESLMLGKPIVMAKNTGFDEIIEEYGIGCTMDFNEQGLIDGLNELYDRKNEWNIIGGRMKQLYMQSYSWDEMEKRLIELYSNF